MQTSYFERRKGQRTSYYERRKEQTTRPPRFRTAVLRRTRGLGNLTANNSWGARRDALYAERLRRALRAGACRLPRWADARTELPPA